MFVDTFVRVGINGLSLDAIARAYAGWMLGGDSDRVRARRLDEGVARSWTVEQVLASEALVGEHGCRVDMRVVDHEVVARFVHRDSNDGAVIWTTVARARQLDERVVVEHAVGRDAPKGYPLFPVAAAPRIVTSLLDDNRVEVFPRQLHLPLVTLRGDDAKGYVDHELLRTDREVPIVAVSCDRGGALPLVDAERLALRVRGLAQVVLLSTERSTFVFGDALAANDFGPEYRCFHAGVHLYGPTAQLRTDHRLWLADTLLDIPASTRTERLAGLIARRLGVRNVPPGFFNLVEEHDREAKRRLAERVAKRPASTPPPPGEPASLLYAAQLGQERDQLRQQLQAAIAREREYAEAWNTADDERRLAEAQRDDAEARLEQERAIAADLRDQLAKMKGGSRPSLTPEVVRGISNVLGGEHTPEDCLVALEHLFPERIVILDTAIASARKSRGFKYCGKLAVLLRNLATKYYESLAAGNGDAVAAEVFGQGFAAKESSVTMASQQAREERTFRYNGGDLLMWPHLRIGNKESIAETIRVHFEWVAAEKKIVIGWCGEHRYKVG